MVDTSLRDSVGEGTRVVVVTPNTAIARELFGKYEHVDVILEQTREGKTAAMNKMLRAVPDGILAYASADTRIDSQVIPALVNELLADPKRGAVIAHVIPVNEKGLMGIVSSLLWNLFNHTTEELDAEDELAQANDLYVFRRELVSEIPKGTINDDTYIATAIRKQGFLIKKAKVGVHVSGPTTPLDYIIQRSRITIGHLQTIKKMGIVPTVFQFTFVLSPVAKARIFKQVIVERGLKLLLAAAVAAPLEALSWCYAMSLSILRKDVGIWRIAPGTKDVWPAEQGSISP